MLFFIEAKLSVRLLFIVADVEKETRPSLFLLSWAMTSTNFLAAALASFILLESFMLVDLSMMSSMSVGTLPQVLDA